jgi:hypothetical protein
MNICYSFREISQSHHTLSLLMPCRSLVDLELESALWSQEKESDPNTFEEQDFPVQPPEWLDMDTYQRRKQELVGKPIWVQDVADEELREIGYSSWKAYAVDSCMSNW